MTGDPSPVPAMLFAALFVLLLLLPSYLAVSYYLGLVAARWVGFVERSPTGQAPKHRFVVVIPAHDEASTIAAAVRSCFEADYPRELLHVVVVADNCTDDTAAIAERSGAQVLRRSAPDARGKGQALQWAFEQLLPTSPADAFLVLDADSRLESNVLRAADGRLQAGARALQTNHCVTNADASPISYAATVGRTLEYDLFFAPKSALGLAVPLVGTGMVFHRSLLEDVPWRAGSCAEDTDYTIELASRGECVRFLADARVRFEGVETFDALHVQRTRWASGNLSGGHRRALRLMLDGLVHRDFKRFDLGWTLLLVSRPLVLTHLACVLLGAALLRFIWPTAAAGLLVALAAALVPLYAVYFAAGIVATGMNATRLRHLLHAPAVVLQLSRIALAGVLGNDSSTWVRTPRR